MHACWCRTSAHGQMTSVHTPGVMAGGDLGNGERSSLSTAPGCMHAQALHASASRVLQHASEALWHSPPRLLHAGVMRIAPRVTSACMAMTAQGLGTMTMTQARTVGRLMTMAGGRMEGMTCPLDPVATCPPDRVPTDSPPESETLLLLPLAALVATTARQEATACLRTGVRMAHRPGRGLHGRTAKQTRTEMSTATMLWMLSGTWPG